MRVAIAGGGIAGLSSAIALARRGFEVELFERATDLKESGAGIQLSPNAMAVLAELGITGDLAGRLSEPRALAIRDGRNGALLKTIPLGDEMRHRYGAPYCTLRRADLQSALLAGVGRAVNVTLTLGSEVHEVRATGDGVAFAAGEREYHADALIAADGVHSKIRERVFGHPKATSLGQNAWRSAIPIDIARRLVDIDTVGLWLGAGGHAVHYPTGGGTHLNLVVIAPGEGSEPPRTPFGRDVHRLMDTESEWSRTRLLESDFRGRWIDGRVALIGDAAHAMAPSAAQGGAQAIEDAWTLSAALAEQPTAPETAFAKFERDRRPRVTRVALLSRSNLNAYALRGVPAKTRNLLLIASPASFLTARLDWLFGYCPIKIPGEGTRPTSLH